MLPLQDLSSLFSSAVEAANSEQGEKEEIAVNEQKEPEHEIAGREEVQEQAAVGIKEDEGEEKSSASILKHEDETV